jgi:hypothetical protein
MQQKRRRMCLNPAKPRDFPRESREARDRPAWSAREQANDLAPNSECQVHPANHAKRVTGQWTSQTQLVANYEEIYDSLQIDFCPGVHAGLQPGLVCRCRGHGVPCPYGYRQIPPDLTSHRFQVIGLSRTFQSDLPSERSRGSLGLFVECSTIGSGMAIPCGRPAR